MRKSRQPFNLGADVPRQADIGHVAFFMACQHGNANQQWMMGRLVHGRARSLEHLPAAERMHVQHPHTQAGGGGAGTRYRVRNVVVLEVEKNIEATPGQLPRPTPGRRL